jgi:hypothetical protein
MRIISALQQLIDTAIADANSTITIAGRTMRKGEGRAESGRFAVAVVLVGRPSTGQSSAISTRIDCYLDGKRVKRAALAAALGEN